MADNVTISSGSVFDAATDDIAGKHYQKTKLVDGTSDSTTPVAYDANRGFLVSNRRVGRLSVTPTISTTIYAIGDAVGGLLTFTNAARFSGAGLWVKSVVIIDKDSERAPLDLVLFDRTFTNSADNAAFDPTDADLANLVGVLSVSNYASFFDNSVGYSDPLDFPALLNGTSLFGQLVTLGTPTYTATSDLIVLLNILQE